MADREKDTAMQQITTTEIHACIMAAGDQYAAEKEVLGKIIKSLLAGKARVTSKALIMYLIGELDRSTDAAQLDLLRNCLKLVVGCAQGNRDA
ncbi:biofilm development regulator YmgB/AriR family protein [Erwinia psidii]|uniref:Transcriptional regulator n=1 Tax=Erwinia psidii TaxID=69224 RepID=A0A3N6S202_9GAMM|nr:biofilm development regulator YmgB/AriR family protein [Erwinia psidii]MCX8957589.1 transcriptional regulator [Erwinia psidii]MCX8960643.1 transcriptional regulator [Erwinia psidii]MCX8964112.1 transcriptional regulator [Erwinia psidii]RQM39594.1 transcriptional regulator [Erwinia psidii]